MSYTMTFDMPERTTEFVRRREERLRPALRSIVVAFVSTQMPYEDSLGVFESVRADHGTLTWPGEIDIAPETVWNACMKEVA